MKPGSYLVIVLLVGFYLQLQGQVISSEKSTLRLKSDHEEVKKAEPDRKIPDIHIITPAFDNDSAINTHEASLNLIGQAIDESGIKSILVNAALMETSEIGVFSTTLTLESGTNIIQIIAIDNHDNYAEKEVLVNYEPPKLSLADKINKEASYYALIIGIEHYNDPNITDLDNPVRDAKELYQVLQAKYTFRKDNIILINDAAHDDIINALDALSRKVTQNDNLLIFYAGHGWWDQESNVGYWLPADATKDSKTKWFRNSTLVDYLKEIDCKHTLLITDACFAGAIFKTRSAFGDAPKAIEKLYELPSRKAMTSGTLTEVPDKSAFVDYLIDRLSENSEKYLSAEQLFSSFRIAVINNSDVVPQFGEIRGVGDEGGEFIFILK
jgi:hypothetical protein